MTDPADFPIVRLSSANLPRRDRLALWREHYGRVIHRAEIELLPGPSFDAALVSRALPGLQAVSEATSGVRVMRTRELVADGNDDLALVINRAGIFAACARGREVTLREGDAVLVSSSDVAVFYRFSLGGSLSLRMPRAMLSSLVVDIDDAVMRPIPRHTAALELLTSHASALLTGSAPATSELRRMAVAHMYDLVTLTLGASRGTGDVARTGWVHAADSAQPKLPSSALAVVG
jgi:hypothetical protein